MAPTDPTLDADWLGACRRAATAIEARLAHVDGAGGRAAETGTRGAGGDQTLVIDADAEALVFAELDELRDAGASFTAISEEGGERSFGDGPVRVVIDPIDGSTNAKRAGSHYALSVAVADGDTMADVTFAYVCDFGAREEWWATRGEGAWRDGVRLDPDRGDVRSGDGRLELVAVESSDPRRIRDHIDGLVDIAHRLRALGTIAVSLCEVASARCDAMVTLRPSRGVDAAAGQLIVREAGGHVAFTDCDHPLGAPLDATPSSRLVAARTEDALRELERLALGGARA